MQHHCLPSAGSLSHYFGEVRDSGETDTGGNNQKPSGGSTAIGSKAKTKSVAVPATFLLQLSRKK